VPEAAELLRVSRNQGYELVHRGVIPVIMLGSRIRVTCPPKRSPVIMLALKDCKGGEMVRRNFNLD
jgi:excisionase family DNA binding protein